MSPPPPEDGSSTAGPATSSSGRLASWKEIAAYLGVTVRTAQRWERLEGLPVHRQMHATLGSAYAVEAELDSWRATRRSERRTHPALPPHHKTSIAVLPFANFTRNLETEILADGITEELISTLAQVPGLGVVARTSAFYFKGKDVDVREVGARLGVDKVLEGSVRVEGGRVRVVAQLIDARTGLHLWSEPFESGRTDLLKLQEDLAHAVAGMLRETLSLPAREPRSAERGAYALYLEGRYYFNRRTPAGFLKAVECFERAVGDDPGLAPAWAALASCYSNATVTTTLTPAEARDTSMRLARQAGQLDPTLAEPETCLGSTLANYFFDWEGAERHFRRAIALQPTDPEARLFYAAFVLAPAARFAEAEEHTALARRLDPLSAVVVNAAGMLRLMLRQYGASAAAFRDALDLDPNYPWAHRGLGEIAILEGRYAEALDALARVEMPNLAVGLIGHARARLGAEGEARLAAQRLEQSGQSAVAYQLAMIHLALNDVDATFRSLERAVGEHGIGVIWLPVDPIWDPIRSDDRFPRLVRSMGLEPAGLERVLPPGRQAGG